MSPAAAFSQELLDMIRWSVPIAAPPAGAPVVAGVVAAVPLRTGAIAGHDLADGRELWRADLAAEQSLGGDEERVYVASGKAIHALDAATGTVVWRTEVGAAPTAPPLAHAGWVIAAAGGDLLAIRATDGAVIWRQQVGTLKFRPALDGELLVLPIAEGCILALDVRDGTTKWKRDLASEPTEPLAVGGRVYVGTADKRFHRLNAASGRSYPHLDVGAQPRGRAAADDRHVYFAAMDNVLRAIDRGNGALRWKQGLTYRPTAGPVALGRYVVVPAADVDTLSAFDARAGTPAGTIAFSGKRLAALPVFGRQKTPFAIGIAGDLDEKWTMTMREPSGVPSIPLEPLMVLPGEVVLPPQPPELAKN